MNSIRKTILAALFIALMAIGANAAAVITIGTVPLTFQTVVAVLAGMLLGWKTGAASMIGYILLGFTGAPVFSQFHNGFSALASPTFGFILSFVGIALVSGLLVEYLPQKKIRFYLAGAAGLIVNYTIGIVYLYYYNAAVLSFDVAVFYGIAASMSAFFIKDAVLVFFAASMAAYLIQSKAVTPVYQNKAG
ncbi:biotin transporter BioY [Alkalicoccus urumqiensis]|nr:biotin transporter BioY [Alkalicoccus urumqiensis]